MKPNFSAFIKNISSTEKFVVLILLFFGLIASLSIPLSAGYDEETHFVRAWEMAHLYLIPNEQLGARLPFPALYWELSYRRAPIVEAVEPGFWNKYGGLRMDAHDYIYANVETRSVYSPVLLLPQALVLRYLGLSLQLPALAVYYACRIVGLLSYLLLCWLAVRLVPFGKWLLAILAVSPMALFQASTINTDSISNGIGFLFLAGSLAIAMKKEITWKAWASLLALIALLFLAKVNLIFLALLPFLLIPPAQFRMKYGYGILIVAALALFLIEVGGWNILAYSHFTRALVGANPTQQVKFILSAPLQFVEIIARDVWINTPAYLQGWVGVYGYDYWPVPGLVYPLYALAVIAGLWLNHNGQTEASLMPDNKTRIILAALFVAGYLLTIISLYVAFTPVGSPLVAGVQGRYFTPVLPLLFLALLGVFDRPLHFRAFRLPPLASCIPPPASRLLPPVSRLPAILASAALILYTGGLILSYHVTCGSEYYRSGLCYQPEYKNWAPETASSPPISSTKTLTQEIVPACDGMTQLSVWVNSRDTDPSGTTTLSLRAPQQEKDVAQQTFTNADISKGSWLTIKFSPEWRSNNQLYLLTMKGSSSGGIRLGYSQKPEYLTGKLFENGAAIAQDVLFQYGCIAGWEKWWGMAK